MKWIKYQHAGERSYGLLETDESIRAQPHSWQDILAGRPPQPNGERLALADVRPLNPAGRPGKLVCIGLNYMDHIRETGSSIPERPLVFAKFTTTVLDPGSPITWSSALTTQVDYEAELAVVIGKTARRVDQSEALGYVAGYTCANDISARDLQMGDGQWIRGKSLDTFCPLGPVFVSADEVPDPQGLDIRCLLNGQTVQDSNTKEMIFSVAELVSFCSHSFTLEPGDVILTGTPHGVGLGRTPPLWLQDGDSVVVEIEAIGRLANPCRVEN